MQQQQFKFQDAECSKDIKPTDDFYGFVNENYMKDLGWRDDYPLWGAFTRVRDSVATQCAELCEADGDFVDSKSDCIDVGIYGMDKDNAKEKYLLGYFYNAYVRSKTGDGGNARLSGEGFFRSEFVKHFYTDPKMSVLKRIAGFSAAKLAAPFKIAFNIDGKSEDQALLPYLTDGSAGLGLGSRDYYLDQTDSNKEIRRKYIDYMVQVLALAHPDVSTEALRSRAHHVLDMETRFAEGSLSKEDMRDVDITYNRIKLKDLGPQGAPHEQSSGSAGQNGIQWHGEDMLFGTSFFRELLWNCIVHSGGASATNKYQEEFFERNGGVDMEVLCVNPKWFSDTLEPEMLRCEAEGERGDVAREAWNDYFTLTAFRNFAEYLDDDAYGLMFKFYGTVLRGVTKLKPLGVRFVNNFVYDFLQDVLGKRYVAEYFPEGRKEQIKEVVSYLVRAFDGRFEGGDVSWMRSEDTRRAAREKLSNFGVKIGYPDEGEWEDYSQFFPNARDPLVNNAHRIMQFTFCKALFAKCYRPFNKKEWYMPAQDVNACCVQTLNEICFPAGILQPPFYDAEDADPAAIFGGIGAVIGHEISHTFDDNGRKFDSRGQIRNWWGEGDVELYEAEVEKIVEQFNKYSVTVPPPSKSSDKDDDDDEKLNMNGKFTAGENIGDLGGVKIAYEAFLLYMKEKGTPYETREGWTPKQRFFLSWARLWAANIRDEEIRRRTTSDCHSLPRFRVNGPLSTISEFHAAFDIKDGDPMYLPPEERTNIW